MYIFNQSKKPLTVRQSSVSGSSKKGPERKEMLETTSLALEKEQAHESLQQLPKGLKGPAIPPLSIPSRRVVLTKDQASLSIAPYMGPFSLTDSQEEEFFETVEKDGSEKAPVITKAPTETDILEKASPTLLSLMKSQSSSAPPLETARKKITHGGRSSSDIVS